jgi:hypothetical protein
MSRVRRIAAIPTGSWAKWVVVGFWVVVLVVAFPASKKLAGAEKNDASAYLPASAESTKVLDVLSHFQSPNIYPGVVVYERASGITAADRAGRHFRRAGHDPVHLLDRARFRGGVRHPARHHHRKVRPGHRAEPRPRPVDVVAQQAGTQARPGTSGTHSATPRRHDHYRGAAGGRKGG